MSTHVSHICKHTHTHTFCNNHTSRNKIHVKNGTRNIIYEPRKIRNPNVHQKGNGYSVSGILRWKFFKNFLSHVLRQMQQHRNMLTKESEESKTGSPHFLRKGPQSRNRPTKTFSAGISLFHRDFSWCLISLFSYHKTTGTFIIEK